MKTIYKYILPLCGAALLSSCSDKGKEGPEDEPRAPIALSGTSATVASLSKASAFPNAGSIGILAARPGGVTPDWTGYADINNAEVTGTLNLDGTTYSYTWNTPKYWPMDNSELIFMAYSPHTANEVGRTIQINSLNTGLVINLTDPMADVLYASNNGALTPYTKSMNVPVDLGEFKHAMSQLTLKVIHPDPPVGSNIQMNSLKVATNAHIATLDLTQGDNGLIADSQEEKFVYTLVDNNRPITGAGFTETVLLFPGTEEVTQVAIELIDLNNTSNSYQGTFLMSFFQNDADPEAPVTLNRGQNTVLTIKVDAVDVNNTEISLQGQLRDWVDGGDFGIVIH